MIQDFEFSGIVGCDRSGRVGKVRGAGLILKKVKLLGSCGLDFEIFFGEVVVSLEGVLEN